MAGFGLGNYINPAVGGFIDQRRNALAGLGAGLLNGKPGTGVQEGIQADDAYAIQQKAEAERQKLIADQNALRAKYADFFTKNGDQGLALAVTDQSISPAEAYFKWIDNKQKLATGGADAPANIREWDAYSKMTPEQKGEYIRMKRANPYLDTGVGFVQPDPINPGQTSGAIIPKDNYTPAYDAAGGAATAKVDVQNQDAVDSLASKMPGLQSVVKELGDLATKATYTQTGQLWDNIVRETGSMPTEGALARTKYMSMVDNQILPLLRDTFGAQFTVQEGESLRATLGAPDKSPAEKQAVLEAFIEQKTRDLEALKSRVPGAAVDYKTEYGLE